MKIQITSEEHIQLLKLVPMDTAIETTLGSPVYLLNPSEDILGLLEKIRKEAIGHRADAALTYHQKQSVAARELLPGFHVSEARTLSKDSEQDVST